MNLTTFYKIYYEHRFQKSSIILRIYIIISLPFNFLINKLFLQPVKNLDDLKKKKPELFLKDLNFLFQYFNSDKGEKYINQYQKPIKQNKELIQGHSYHPFYEKFFASKKNDKINLLEIGSFKGNAAAAFFFYFPNSSIISGDIFPDLFRYRSERIKNFYLDNSEISQLEEKILNYDHKFDIIIEDAGHYLKDQIISLFVLFKSLKSNGVFVIEELEFPNIRDDMNPKKEKPSLKDILELINHKKNFSSEYVTKSQKEYFLENFKNIEIFKGTSSEIAFITKK
tara:strand:+ start:731 stop:1579 length:849 start_codon:yes stop_codon:yes gene_type:complete